MRTAFGVENKPVFMKFPETVVLGGKLFVMYWKGTPPFSTPKGTTSHSLLKVVRRIHLYDVHSHSGATQETVAQPSYALSSSIVRAVS